MQKVRSYSQAGVRSDECSAGICFDHGMGNFSIQNEKNVVSGNFDSCKGKGKGNYLTSVAKQAKTAFLHGPTV